MMLARDKNLFGPDCQQMIGNASSFIRAQRSAYERLLWGSATKIPKVPLPPTPSSRDFARRATNNPERCLQSVNLFLLRSPQIFLLQNLRFSILIYFGRMILRRWRGCTSHVEIRDSFT